MAIYCEVNCTKISEFSLPRSGECSLVCTNVMLICLDVVRSPWDENI